MHFSFVLNFISKGFSFSVYNPLV